MSPAPIAPLYDDDDIARARAANAVLLPRDTAQRILDFVDRQWLGDAQWAFAEPRAALKPPEPVVVIPKRRTGR